jgi:hypothetical protein
LRLALRQFAALIAELEQVNSGKQMFACAKQHRSDGQVHLVNQLGA